MTAATPSARVSKARRGSIDRGAVRIEVILRDPVAIGALARLRARHGSMRAAIEHAIRIAATPNLGPRDGSVAVTYTW